MTIKDYKCKCGHDDFFFADKGNQKGIYCSYCGKWYKWADKDEQNLTLKQDHCDTCGYEEGNIYCKEHCPHEAKVKQESSDNAIDRAVSLNAVKDLFCSICMESDLCYQSKETCEDLRLFDKLPPVDRWIPVKESLPKTAREVKVTDGTDVFIGWYDGTEWRSSSELFWPYTDPITA